MPAWLQSIPRAEEFAVAPGGTDISLQGTDNKVCMTDAIAVYITHYGFSETIPGLEPTGRQPIHPEMRYPACEHCAVLIESNCACNNESWHQPAEIQSDPWSRTRWCYSGNWSLQWPFGLTKAHTGRHFQRISNLKEWLGILRNVPICLDDRVNSKL